MSTEIEALYLRYAPMVLRRCRQLMRDEAQALDIMQDVFVKLLEHQQRLRLETPSSLLYRMATNLCLNRIRDTRRVSNLTSLGQQDSDDLLSRIAVVDDASEQVAAGKVLMGIFGRYPESTRTIAVLHLHDGLTLQQVADEVGMSVSGVRKRLRTLKAFIQELQE